jgi:hypothetical protein
MCGCSVAACVCVCGGGARERERGGGEERECYGVVVHVCWFASVPIQDVCLMYWIASRSLCVGNGADYLRRCKFLVLLASPQRMPPVEGLYSRLALICTQHGHGPQYQEANAPTLLFERPCAAASAQLPLQSGGHKRLTRHLMPAFN